MEIITKIPDEIEMEMRVLYGSHPSFIDVFFNDKEATSHYEMKLAGYVECRCTNEDIICAEIGEKKFVPMRRDSGGRETAFFLAQSRPDFWDIVRLNHSKGFHSEHQRGAVLRSENINGVYHSYVRKEK